ncbi:MAG: c-type cytochrome [Nitrospirota bacterium]
MKHSTFKLFGIALALWGLTVAPAAWSAEPWKVPAEESKKKNPVKADAASIGKGKKIFAERCAICHGEKADGKGASASALNPPPASFLDKKYMAANSDGDLSYKTANGRGMMPRWDIVLEENDIWSVVNYLRSLGKK